MIITKVSWQHVKELLHEALLLAPEQRVRFLDEACYSNDSLRAEIESLLAAGEDVRDTFLHSPLQSDESSQLAPGQVFAERFLLLRKLGEGGMGQVWLADQVYPVRRQVALKLIKAGMYDKAVVQRFPSERQALAMMDHPAIAKVFGVEQFTTLGVSITGLDASRVVTASISNSELAITTWSVSTAGVAYQNMYSTSKNYPYEEVSITAISSSQVVAVFRDALGPFAVEEFTINAEGVPTPVGAIYTSPEQPSAIQVWIADLNGAQVVTATNDSNGNLNVQVFDVDSAGVHPVGATQTISDVSARLGTTVAITAGTKIRLNGKFPFLEYVQSAVTPTIYNNNVDDFYWSISDTSVLTQTLPTPPSTTSEDYFYVSACMLPQNTAITVYADDYGTVHAGRYGIEALGTWNSIPTGAGENFVGLAAAGSDPSLGGISPYNAYFVTAELTYHTSATGPKFPNGDPVGTLKVQEWKYYPIDPSL